MHENYVRYLTTLTTVNAIIAVGNAIQASLSEGASAGESGKAFKKTLDELREALIPGEKTRSKKRVEEIRKILEKEAAGGPIKVKPMTTDKKVKMKRR